MTLRRQLILYVVFLNCVPLALGVFFLVEDQLYWFFLTELSLLFSIPLGALMIRRALQPMELLQSSKLNIQREDFAARFLPVGIKEMDSLIELYNQMLGKLHEEHLLLGEQRGFFDKLLQATPTGILIFDFDDLISNANPAAEKILESSLADLKGKTLEQLNSALALAINEKSKSDREEFVPGLLTLPNGQRYRVQQSDFYDRGFSRKFLMLEELTEELQSVERQAYENLIRMTSHEVKNTIGVTNSLLQGCKEYCQQLKQKDREDFAKSLSVVIGRNLNLAEFMTRLALVVHLPTPDCQQLDICQILETLKSMFAVELKRRNILWVPECENVPLVNIDGPLFEQALINIIKNAYEAVDRDGEITIKLSKEDREVVLCIRDSAGSLSSKDRSNLFKPFYTSKSKGQGVGLMLVRDILNQHGFRYSLQCDEQKWTEFQIRMKVNPC